MITRGRVFQLINVIIFLVCVVVMILGAGKAQTLMRSGVFYVSPFVSSEKSMFTSRQTESINNFFVSYEITGEVDLITTGMSVFTKVIYTNGNYNKMVNLNIVSGNFFTENSAGDNVIVISKALAWKLFGDFDVVGKTVFIKNDEYKIFGIVELEKNDYFAWLPQSNKSQLLNGLYLKSKGYNKLDSYVDAYNTLEKLGLDLRNYRIADTYEYTKIISARYKFAFSILFCVVALYLSILLYKTLRARGNKKYTIPTSILYAATIIVIFSQVNFEIWVKEKGILPLLKTFANSNLLPDSHYLSYSLMKLYEINNTTLIAFIISIVAIANISFFMKINKRGGKNAS